MQPIKLLALDMDGTTHHQVSDIISENIAPIQQALALGVKVVFITGRPVLGEKNQIVENHLITKDCGIIVGCNAGCIYDLNTNQVLQANPIDATTAQQVFELCVQNNVLAWGYTTDLNTVVISQPIVTDEQCTFENRFFKGEILQYQAIKDHFDYQFFKILAFDGNRELFNTMREQLHLNVASNDDKIAEINRHGINKAFGLKWLSDYFNIPMHNIAAIGDGMNDYEMLKLAGVGVAIKNSHPQLKQVADIYIDQTNVEGAVKHFIETYILKEKHNES